jgi:hypothetical protein
MWPSSKLSVCQHHTIPILRVSPNSSLAIKSPMSLDRQCALYNEAPPTAMDLREYKTSVISPFEANDGRVNPPRYGSNLDKDLGLCQTTFLEKKMVCRKGMRCPWRHQALTRDERIWIKKLEGGERFLERPTRTMRSRACRQSACSPPPPAKPHTKPSKTIIEAYTMQDLEMEGGIRSPVPTCSITIKLMTTRDHSFHLNI